MTSSMDKKKQQVYSRIIRYLHPHRAGFIGALACMVIFAATEGGIPFMLKYMVDDVFQSKAMDKLYFLPVLLISFSLFRGAFDFGQSYLMARAGHLVVRDVRAAVNNKLLQFSPSYFITNSSGDLQARITGDVMLIRTLLTDTSGALIRDFIKMVALVGSVFYLDPTLALMAFVGFPLGALPIIKFGKRMRRLSKRGQGEIGVLSAKFQETVVGNRVVKLFSREEFERQRFEELNRQVTRTFISSERVKALTGPVNELIAFSVISLVVMYGAYSVLSGERSVGLFTGFLAALYLLYDPFKKLSKVNNSIQQGLAGAERIFEVLDTPVQTEEIADPIPLTSSNELSLDNVSFTYPGAGRPALNGISLRVPEGKTYALVGFSGSGKSTLIDLLPRFIDPQEGQVGLGGVDIRQAALKDLRSRIAMVGQHTFLFNESILFNITYGKEGASQVEVKQAAQAAYALEFIKALPEGFNTLVGEGGYSLSGGERQRISIARAILKQAPILVLDEATAALDNRSEREVQSALEQLMHGRTSIVIAHRLSTVQNADQIVVLREGEIVERGTHEELLTLGGEYSKLYAMQFRE